MRIPLIVSDGRLVLLAAVASRHLRLSRQIVEFVIDTGSPNSLLSPKDVSKLQIPVTGKPPAGTVQFAGSQYDMIELPAISMQLLDEERRIMDIDAGLRALRSNRTSERKRAIAQTLPSIVGLDFLRRHRLSLHVILSEGLAYLQTE